MCTKSLKAGQVTLEVLTLVPGCRDEGCKRNRRRQWGPSDGFKPGDPLKFPWWMVQSSLGCASVSHFLHTQCSFFTVSIYHCLPVLVYVGRDNARLNLATLKIKCHASLQVVFFTSKQLYLVMEESRQKEMGVNRLKWILPPFQKWMHIYLNCLIGVGYVNELLISTHALFCYNEVTNQIRTKISL